MKKKRDFYFVANKKLNLRERPNQDFKTEFNWFRSVINQKQKSRGARLVRSLAKVGISIKNK